MCGVAGILGEGASQCKEAVTRMVRQMHHRGPDDHGLYESPSGLCVLGHARLSILDLSSASHQPMVSQDGAHVLSYNGELYNFPELRRDLIQKGVVFRTRGDTEVLLELLEREGEECLTRLNGMFAFAFWDERRRRLLIGRDRYGQKPLYTARTGKLFLFASEIRALLASGMVERHLSFQGVTSYLSFGAVQGPDTIISGVSLIPAGSSAAAVPGGDWKTNKYWTPPTRTRRLGPEELRSDFTSAVNRHMVSDVPIGIFLSGGIDSSAIATAAAQSLPGGIRTMSVVFPDDQVSSEAKYARTVAETIRSNHHEIPVTGSDMLSLLPLALSAMDQPTIDAINTFVVSNAARLSGLKVALSGLGGDELFGGYSSFRDVPFLAALRMWLSPLNDLRGSLPTRQFFGKRASKIIDLFDSPGGITCSYLVRRRLFSSSQLHALIPTLTPAGWISGIPSPRLSSIAKDLLLGRSVDRCISALEIDLYMGETLLRDSDTMGMANSLEIRAPFLDSDFSTKALMTEPFDSPLKVPRKPRLVEAFKGMVPDGSLYRRKQGFMLPFERWMLRELAEGVASALNTLSRSIPFLNAKVCEDFWKAFKSSPSSVGWARPWSLFILGQFVERNKLTVN